MRYIQRRVTTRVHRFVSTALAMALTACSDPVGPGGNDSSFSAEISGARNERLSGAATASASWARETVISVTLPGAGTFSTIALAGSDLKTTISFTRAGTELPAGTHRIGRIPNTTPSNVPMFTSGYVIRDGDRLQVFMADSGSVTIAEAGQRVKGSFTVYLSHYSVMPVPTREQVGQLIKPIASGTAPITITGTFDAGRR